MTRRRKDFASKTFMGVDAAMGIVLRNLREKHQLSYEDVAKAIQRIPIARNELHVQHRWEPIAASIKLAEAGEGTVVWLLVYIVQAINEAAGTSGSCGDVLNKIVRLARTQRVPRKSRTRTKVGTQR